MVLCKLNFAWTIKKLQSNQYLRKSNRFLVYKNRGISYNQAGEKRMELDEKLTQARKAAGLTQADVAARLDVSRQAVSRWEGGQSKPSTERLLELARIYDVSLDWLCSDVADEKSFEVVESSEDNEITNAMEQVNLDPNSRKRVGKYSLGMRQRLGIAQAIMEHPRYLILDEPMNGLDTQGVKDVRELLQKQKEAGVTVILASHSMEDIRLLCDTVHRIQDASLIPCTTEFS